MYIYFSENGEWRETDVKKQPFFIANSKMMVAVGNLSQQGEANSCFLLVG